MTSSKDPLSVLFGSNARVKLLRLFLFNPNLAISFDEVLRRARLVRRTARTELNALERTGIVKKKFIYESVPNRTKKKRVQGYLLDHKFPYLKSLQTFLFETAPLNSKTVTKHLRKVGRLDVVVIAGVFMRDFDQRLDLVVASKNIQSNKLEQAIQTLEAEIGIEVRFASFKTGDFMYRVKMYDKLTRDVFDYPHQILVDRVNLAHEIVR